MFAQASKLSCNQACNNKSVLMMELLQTSVAPVVYTGATRTGAFVPAPDTENLLSSDQYWLG